MFLFATARNDVLQHCLMFYTMDLHSTARNDMLLHSMALPLCCGMVHCAMALFTVPWPCFVIVLL